MLESGLLVACDSSTRPRQRLLVDTRESANVRQNTANGDPVEIKTPNELPTKNSLNQIRQWVSRVVDFSSQYNDNAWSADNVIGQPMVYPNYGDLESTWAQDQGGDDDLEFIEIEFPEKVFVQAINIYETYNAGAIVSIKLKNASDDSWLTVWENPDGPVRIQSSRIFSPSLDRSLFKTNQVRLELDCTTDRLWCELDAIEVVGKKYQVDNIDVERILADDFKQMFLSEEYSDVEFEVSGQRFKAHRNILAMRSNHFRSMLCDNLKEDRMSRPIIIEDMTPRAFRALLLYMYTNTIGGDSNATTDCETACELMRQSEWYDLPDLKVVAFQHVSQILDIENACTLIVNASEPEPVLEECVALALKFIVKNFPFLCQREDFKQLPQEILVKIAKFYGELQN